jgi:hypothetical protein
VRFVELALKLLGAIVIVGAATSAGFLGLVVLGSYLFPGTWRGFVMPVLIIAWLASWFVLVIVIQVRIVRKSREN